MSKVEKTANVQSVAYASAYAIQIVSSINYDDGAQALFLEASGTATAWPHMAWQFDTVEDARREQLTAALPVEYEHDEGAFLRVVKLDFSVDVKVVGFGAEICVRAA